jgi:putative flippase GtrA
MPALPSGIHRFLHYTLWSVLTFVLDIGLLWGLTTFFHVPYYISTPVALLIAITINYIFVRQRKVFAGTERSMSMGFVYFALLALISAVAITAAVAYLVTYLHMYYLLARTLVGVVTGTVNYLLNLYFNFRVAGRHT